MSKIERVLYETQDGKKYEFSGRRYLMSFTGLGMSPVKYASQDSRRTSGEVLLSYAYQKRVIQLSIRVQGCNREEYWKIREKLVRMMRPNRTPYGLRFLPGTLKIYRPGLPAVGIDVVIESGLTFSARDTTKWDEAAISETIRWIAHNPLFYALERTCVTFSFSGITDLTFPIIFPIQFSDTTINASISALNNGHVPVSPVIVANGQFTGGFQVTNHVGKVIRYNYAVDLGEEVIIDTRNDRMTATSSTKGDVRNGIDWDISSIEEFRVYPEPDVSGGINTFTCQTFGIASPGASVDIVWRDMYVGI